LGQGRFHLADSGGRQDQLTGIKMRAYHGCMKLFNRPKIATCETCGGAGWIGTVRCYVCKGSGAIA
jgi:DnaJ-class molecular chaperone